MFFTLSVVYGRDVGELLWSGEALTGHVTEEVIPLIDLVMGFLVFRATRGRLGKRLRAGRGALQTIAAVLGVAGEAELGFAAGATIALGDPTHPLAYRNGGLTDWLAVSSYLLLALGLVNFPLTPPLYDLEGPAPAIAEEPLSADIPQPAMLPHLEV